MQNSSYCFPTGGHISKKVHGVNCILCMVGFVLMVYAGFMSDSSNSATVEKFPYMVMKISVPAIKDICVEIGLSATCAGECGASCNVNLPAFEYSSLIENCPLPTLRNVTQQIETDKVDFCNTVSDCQAGGQVTFVFCLLSSAFSFFGMMACMMRVKYDSGLASNATKAFVFAKYSSILAFLCAVTAYISIQWCAHGMENLYQDAIDSIPGPNALSVPYDATVTPGIGGAFTIISFVCLFFVALLNWIYVPPSENDITVGLLSTNNPAAVSRLTFVE
jgi:hypothetical protein